MKDKNSTRKYKVSVIVPTHNSEETIERCIDSIYDCYTDDCECIVVDDGSTDQTLSVCDKLKEKHKDLVVLSQENKGVSVARNNGMSVASGEYITFVDSDDYVNKIDYSFLESNKSLYNLGCCKVRNGTSFPLKFKHTNVQDDLIKYPVILNSVCDKLFLSVNIKKSKIEFDEGIHVSEDVGFVIKYLMEYEGIEFIDCQYYNYVDNPKSVTNSKKTKERIHNDIKAADRIEETLTKYGKKIEWAKYIKYKRLGSRLQFITDVHAYDVNEFNRLNTKGELWTSTFKPHLFVLTLTAKYHLYFINDLYIFIKKKVKKIN